MYTINIYFKIITKVLHAIMKKLYVYNEYIFNGKLRTMSKNQKIFTA